MEKTSATGEAGALAEASEKKPHIDNSHMPAVPKLDIGNNPPHVMEGVIKKVLSVSSLLFFSLI